MKDILLLLRPQQWLKNLFIFLPLFFDRHLLDAAYVLPAVQMFVAYCLAASGIYCFNDIHDVDSDRRHPEKCRRPIASGAVSVGQGYAVMAVCFALAFAVIAFCPWPGATVAWTLSAIIAFYIVMNIAYCVRLKHMAVVDVFTIATGFVLRIMAGGVAACVWLSHWIVLMTFLLALFLAFAKRRDDVALYEAKGVQARQSLSRYNLAFINQAIAIVASVTIVCYIMYSVSPEVTARFGSQYIYVTSLFVIAGIIRYLQLTIVDEKSGSPTKVLVKDRFIHVCLAGWLATFALILYL